MDTHAFVNRKQTVFSGRLLGYRKIYERGRETAGFSQTPPGYCCFVSKTLQARISIPLFHHCVINAHL